MLNYRGTAVEVMRAVKSGGVFDNQVANWIPVESLDEPLPFPENIITWVDMWYFHLSAAQIILPPLINMTMSLNCSFDEVVQEKMTDMCIKLFPVEINGQVRFVWFTDGEVGWWCKDGDIFATDVRGICEGIAMVNERIVEFGDGLHALLAASHVEMQESS